jgi:hypothetical protein
MNRALAAVLAATAAVTLASCGPSEEETFRKEKLRPAQQQIERQKSQISAQLQVVRLGRKRDADAVGKLVDQMGAMVSAMGRLKAPESLTDTFHRYVIAHRHLVASLQRFARLLGGRSQSALNREAGKAQSAAGEVARARDALDAKLIAAKG